MLLPTFLLLLAGHVLADFVWQSSALVARKHDPAQRGRALGVHTAQVWVSHALFLLVWDLEAVLLASSGLALLHVAIDRWKLAQERNRPHPLRWFLWDQLLHLACLLAVALWLSGIPEWLNLEVPVLQEWISFAALFSFVVLNLRFASTLIAGFLAVVHPQPESPAADADGPRVGRMIGMLERTLLFLVLVQGAWGAAGFVIAAKSVVRYKQLEQKAFAEYYLLGTLASFLFAILSALAFRACLERGWGGWPLSVAL